MIGPSRPYTAIVPWYEEADFAELSAIGGQSDPAENSYELWYRGAMQSIDDLLREGKAIEIVTVRPTAYAAWLDGRRNTLEMRRRYVGYLVTDSDPSAG